MGAVLNYFREVRLELSKVTWPKREQVVKLTLIVFIISAIVAGYVGGLDLAFTKFVSILITK